MRKPKIQTPDEGLNSLRARQPWLKFYPSNWRSDTGLNSCSPAARCLWFELLLIMHESPRRGWLILPDDEEVTPDNLAPLVRLPAATVYAGLAELERKSVCSRHASGILYSRKMVRESRVSDVQAAKASRRWGIENARQSDAGISPAHAPAYAEPHAGADANAYATEAQSLREEEPPKEREEKEESRGGSLRVRDPASARVRMAAASIWAVVPALPRQWAKNDIRKVQWALQDLESQGAEVEYVAERVVAYYEHPRQKAEDGRYAWAPHRGIEDGRWSTWSGGHEVSLAPKATPPPPGVAISPQVDGRPGDCGPDGDILWGRGIPFKRPPGGQTHYVGDDDNPGPHKQWGWLEEYREDDRKWDTAKRGPPPGAEGSRFWPDVLFKWAQAQKADAAAAAVRRASTEKALADQKARAA